MLTLEYCINFAKNFKNRTDLKKSKKSVYNKLKKNNLLDKLFPIKSKWTKEYCVSLIKECKSRSELNKKYPYLLKVLNKNGWNDLKDNLIPLGSRYKRCVYAYEFSDNSVYVGVTYNIEKRNKAHLKDKNSAVYKHIKITGIYPILNKKTDYIEYYDASKMEGIILNEYKKNNWNILNVAKTGGLGGSIKIKNSSKRKRFLWTYEKCLEEAKKYKTKKELSNNSPSAYCAIRRNGWTNEMCKHMTELVHKKWDIKDAINEAKKYETVREFCSEMNGLYQVVLKNGWENLVMSHMKKGHSSLYNDEIVSEMVKKFHTFREMERSSDSFIRGCYWWILKNKKTKELKKFLIK